MPVYQEALRNAAIRSVTVPCSEPGMVGARSGMTVEVPL